jgi:hypothetical protein
MKTATAADFKVGTKLVCKMEGWTMIIRSKEQDGVWIARTQGGDKCAFECEASCFYVAE